jgi:guanosine-3',5'-bis(diphosphate) 3'-pyrophosphohydrolase
MNPDSLFEKIKSYDTFADLDLIKKAYDFTCAAHLSQKRASGAPYYTHPVAVASILADLRLDMYTIITALLHDTVEDTSVTLNDIEKNFGPQVSKLVDGVTKLTRLEFQSDQERQAENFRKLVLAMSSDIRVLLVKLADRLHNMRTLHFIEDDVKRKRIAQETMDIYVPLCERIGMEKLKDEMEDLSFQALHPDIYESIHEKRDFINKREGASIDGIINELKSILENSGLTPFVYGRQKTIFSIWRKMRNKNISFEQLSDVMAFRILVNTIPECYQSLGIIHSRYSVISGRFKDYISTPKPNNYQSIHTSVVGLLGQRIETQIRTKEMHQVAELGVAAHWNYKQGGNHDGRQYAWLRGLVEIMEETNVPEEFLENTKMEMFQDQVFCFTPKGDLICLPKGSTPLDFAYSIHSRIGHHTTSAKVNGRQVPLRTVLNNGDQVEVITSQNQKPSPAWERYVATGKARASIRKYIRSQQKDQFYALGRSILFKSLNSYHMIYNPQSLEKIAAHLKLESLEDLLIQVGEGRISAHQITSILMSSEDYLSSVLSDNNQSNDLNDNGETNVSVPANAYVKGITNETVVHYAACCHPVPGDVIAGVMVPGKGITIHTKECEILSLATTDVIMDLSWNEATGIVHDKHVTRLNITFINKPGSLASTTTTISQQGGNILNLKITNRSTDFWELYMDVEVRNVEHISIILGALRNLPILVKVERV